MTCSIGGCQRAVFARGWCSAHYFRWKRNGDVRSDVPVRDGEKLPCSVDGCDRDTYARSFCEMHYRRWTRTGNVERSTNSGSCSAAHCDRPASSRGLCHSHYQRLLRTGDVQEDRPLGRRKHDPICSVPGCDRESSSHGLCRAHAHRMRRHGDVRAGVPIRIVSGDGWVTNGYRYISVPRRERHLSRGATKIEEHRLVMARELGRPLEADEVVHHLNGDRLDNRPDNLELWSTYQPKGQRIADKVEYALDMLRRYAPDLLHDERPSP